MSKEYIQRMHQLQKYIQNILLFMQSSNYSVMKFLLNSEKKLEIFIIYLL